MKRVYTPLTRSTLASAFAIGLGPWIQLPQKGAYRGEMKRLTLPGTPSKGFSHISKSAKIMTLFVSQPFYCFLFLNMFANVFMSLIVDPVKIEVKYE